MNDCIVTIQEEIAQGNVKSFAALHNMFFKKLKDFAQTLTRSGEIAEEVVEDVFVQMWVNRAEITKINNLVVYLYKATKNRALNALSRTSQNLITASFDFLDIDVQELSPDPHELMVTSQMLQNMNDAVESLPPKCKMIFKLIREDGLKYKEVAEILNISVNTIDVQMAIAVERICKTLKINKKSSLRSLLKRR